MSTRSRDAELAAEQAGLMIDIGRPGPALEVLGPYLRPGLDTIALLEQAARAVLQLRHYPEVLRFAQRMVELEPDVDVGPYYSSRALGAMGQWKPARQAAERAVQLGPDNARNHVALGAALIARGEWTLGLNSYQQAIRLDPAEPIWRISYASRLIDRTLIHWPLDPVAERHLQAALKLDPDNAWAMHELGRLAESQGKRSVSLQNYGRALRTDPQQCQSEDGVMRIIRTAMVVTFVAILFLLRAGQTLLGSGGLAIASLVLVLLIAGGTALKYVEADAEGKSLIRRVIGRNKEEAWLAAIMLAGLAALTIGFALDHFL